LIPVHYASRSGNIEIIEFLIKHGADINAKDMDIQTKIMVFHLFKLLSSIIKAMLLSIFSVMGQIIFDGGVDIL